MTVYKSNIIIQSCTVRWSLSGRGEWLIFSRGVGSLLQGAVYYVLVGGPSSRGGVSPLCPFYSLAGTAAELSSHLCTSTAGTGDRARDRGQSPGQHPGQLGGTIRQARTRDTCWSPRSPPRTPSNPGHSPPPDTPQIAPSPTPGPEEITMEVLLLIAALLPGEWQCLIAIVLSVSPGPPAVCVRGGAGGLLSWLGIYLSLLSDCSHFIIPLYPFIISTPSDACRSPLLDLFSSLLFSPDCLYIFSNCTAVHPFPIFLPHPPPPHPSLIHPSISSKWNDI